MKSDVRKVLFGGVLLIAITVFIFTPYRLALIVSILSCAAILVLNRSIKIAAINGGGGKGLHGRNFDNLLLGSTTLWKYIDKNEIPDKNLISFAFYERTLFSNWLILNHMFSYLREGGNAVVTVDCNRMQHYCSRKLTFADIQLFHRITLKSLGIDREKFQYQSYFPILFYPLYSVRIVLAKTFGSGNGAQNKRELTQQQQEYITSLLSEMVDFCSVRQLVLKIAFINYNQPRQDVLAIKHRLETSYIDIKPYLLSGPDQIKSIL